MVLQPKIKSCIVLLTIASAWASCKSAGPADSSAKYLDPSRTEGKPGIQDFEIASQGTTEHCIIMGGYPELGPEQEKKVFDSKKAVELCD